MKLINRELYKNALIQHSLEFKTNQLKSELTEALFLPYITYLSKRLEREGLRKVIEVNKQVRLSVTRFIAGSPWNPPYMKGNKNCLPDCLGPLRKFVESREKQKLRYTLSILAVTKPLKLPISPDFKPIESPPNINWDGLPGFQEYLDNQKRFPKNQLNLRSDSSDLSFLTTKSGPNGQALMTSLLDLTAMPDRLAELLYGLATKYMECVIPLYSMGPDKIRAMLTDLGGKLPKQLKLRKITPIEDKEGKTRIIAIGDYFTQAVLRPIHLQLMKYLGEIPQDMTKDQRGHPKEFGSPHHHYHSFDLTAATDRFPVSIQRMILESLTGDEEGSKMWEEIMTGFPFSYRDKTITYGCGQHMGLYSSWAAFAVSHHVILNYSAYLVGKPDFSDYLLLGDDIVIRDDDVARSYRSVIESLGVEISVPKTLISKDTFEFAKKLYHQGEDISPIPGWSLALSKSSTELAGSLSEIFKTYEIEPNSESIRLIMGLVIGNSPSRAKALGSARRLIPLLVYFPMRFEGIGKRDHNPTKLVNFMKIIFPNLPCWNVMTMETLLDLLVTETVNRKYIPALKRMLVKYTDIQQGIGAFTQQNCSDQDPSSISVIPVISILNRLTRELEETYEKVMTEWVWENQNPIPFKNLGIVDPLKLTLDREHLQILGNKADFTIGIRNNGRLMVSQSELTPQNIQDNWIDVVGELSESC